jgi:hypothetical protein
MIGSASLFPELAAMRGTAMITGCGKYRYQLTREWGEEPTLLFILLNPSTADAEYNDPTVLKCVRYAKRWGYGRLVIVNLFAYRSTDPAQLLTCDNPVGLGNDAIIYAACEEAAEIVCGWGAHGSYLGRGVFIQRELVARGYKPVCLGLCQNGEPKHPLYLSNDAERVHYERA